MKNLIFALSILMGLPSFSQSQAPYDPTNDLMTVFGNKCKGNGPLNVTAFNESQSLRDILTNVGDEPNCKGLKSALQDVASLNIGRALSQPENRINIESLVGESANLQLAIDQEKARGSAADAEYIKALKTNLIELRVQINKLSEGQKISGKKDRLDMIRNLSGYSTALMNSMEQGDTCFTNRSNVPSQIGAQMLGIASGLGSGLSGSLILTAGNFIDHFIRFIRKRSIDKDIQKIVDVRLGQALGCAFEGISKTYCEAVDYDTLLKANKEAKTQTETYPSWKKGMNAIAQGTPAFNSFVDKIKAGSPKTTAGLVSDTQQAQSSKGQLDQLITQKDYLTNAGIKDVESAQGKAKEMEFKNLLSKFSQMITPSCGSTTMSGACLAYSGPFRNSFIEDASCGPMIYVYTKGQERTMRAGTAPNTPCSQYIQNLRPQPLIQDLPKIKEAMDGIFSEGTEFVTKELSKVQQSSNIQVLASAQLNIAGRTTLDYFKDSDNYLESLLQDSDSIAKDEHIKVQIQETQKRIRTVVGLIQTKAPSSEDQAASIVAKVANELIPKGDQAAIPSSLSQIVQLDVENKVKKGEVDSTLAILMQLPNSGSMNQLLQVYGDIDASAQQARDARELSEGNISALASTFIQPLKARFETLKRKADQKNEDAEKSLATLCLQTLAVPEAPEIKDLNLNVYCNNTVMKSEYDSSGIELRYNDIARGNQKVRMCSLHDMYRRSSLYGKKKEYQERANSTK